jgi:hypothetical protein
MIIVCAFIPKCEYTVGWKNRGFEFRHWQEIYLISKAIQTGSGTHSTCFSLGTRDISRGVKFTIHFHLMPKNEWSYTSSPVAYRGGFGGFKPPPPKFQSFDKSEPNSQFLGKYIRNTYNNTGFTHLQIERNPWLGGYRPQIPVFSALCPQLNLLNAPPPPCVIMSRSETVSPVYRHSTVLSLFL